MNIIQAAGICFDYLLKDENDKVIERQTALSDLNLEIEKGSFVCILGHNGSGKSTFAKLINALNLPKEGTMLVSGMDTRDESHVFDIRKTAGMVFQNPDNQIISNVVEEDIGFGPENLGVPTEEIEERVESSLEALGLKAYRFNSPNRLSGGQKQRVAIAGIMAMRPECIILDEPTAMLDPSGRADVLRAVHELNKSAGITIVLITHYMEEAVDADRVIVMEKGSIAMDRDGKPMDGTPREIFRKVEELKALSLTVPAIAGLAHELRESGLELPEGILTRGELIEALERIRC